jgi:hypothetical protein
VVVGRVVMAGLLLLLCWFVVGQWLTCSEGWAFRLAMWSAR